ncbi:MAG TPA: PDZ domain-containing protein [Planctomycetota bacterium]|nr:PDZ domain-containing protein [Planctomycetota bacterium]
MRALHPTLLLILLPGCVIVREMRASDEVSTLRSVVPAAAAESSPAASRPRGRTTYSIRSRGELVIETQEDAPVARMGLTPRTASPAEARAAGLAEGGAFGVKVLAVEKEGPSARAGIEPGDLLTNLDGVDLLSADQLRDLLRRSDTTKPVPVLGRRRGEPFGVNLSLESRIETRRRTEYRTLDHAREATAFGLEAATVPEDLAEILFDRPGPAVLLSDVPLGSPAYRAGLRQGDQVLAVNGTELRSASDLLERLQGAREARFSASDAGRPFETTVRARKGFGRFVSFHFPLVVGWESGPVESGFELVEGLLFGCERRERPAPRRERRTRTSISALLDLFEVVTSEEGTRVRLLWFIRFGSWGG